MKDKALPVFKRSNVERGKNKEANIKLHSSGGSYPGHQREEVGETMVTLPDENAVYDIGSNEAGVIHVKGIKLLQEDTRTRREVKSKDDSSLRLTEGSIFRLLKLKNISSILEKMQFNGIFLGATDDWIYKVLYYRCLQAICRIP